MDLSSLINEVLTMAKDSQRYNRDQQTPGRWEGDWITGPQLDERRKKRYEADTAAKLQESAMQTQAGAGESALALERARGANTLANTGLTEAGATGRTALQFGPGGASDRDITGKNAREALRYGPGGQSDREIAGMLKGQGMQRDWTTRGQDVQFGPGGQGDRNLAGAEKVATIGLGKQKSLSREALIEWIGKTTEPLTPQTITAMSRGLKVLDVTPPTSDDVRKFYTPSPVAPTITSPSNARATLGTLTTLPAANPLRRQPLSWNARGETVGGDIGLPMPKTPATNTLYTSPAQQAEDERLREEAKRRRQQLGY